jgi:MFS family permease
MPRQTKAYEKQLEKNIAKYAWYKIFTKRVYLPLITIQLVNVGKVTIEELALIIIITSAVQGLLQVPSGYVADKIGNRKAIILGAAIAVTSPLFYAFMPNFWGGLIASILFFGGYAFQSGAIEAFMHDTLIALNREKEYSKVMGRAQTFGLIGNIALVALVPLTYSINHTLPFILGFLSLVAMLWLTISFVYPEGRETHKAKKNPINAIRSIVTVENIALFIFCGFLSGISNKGGEFRELVFQDIGIAISLFGVILALSSLAGAVMGWYVHILDRLKPLAFYMLDLTIIAISLAGIGLTTNQYIAVGAFTLFAGYTRVRMIIFQSKMLTEIKHTYKATLISALNLFVLFGDILAISLITHFVTASGYQSGYVLFACAVFAIGTLLWLLILIEHKYRSLRRI